MIDLKSFFHRFGPLQHFKILKAASQALAGKDSPIGLQTTTNPPTSLGQTAPNAAGLTKASRLLNSLELVARLDERLSQGNPGWQLELKPSSLGNHAGTGVFIKKGMSVAKGSILCMYPGVVYDDTSSSLFLQSLRNSYIFKSFDGVLVDGKAFGLSGMLFKSHQKRHKWKSLDFTSLNVNPFFLGQLVNNGGDKSKGIANCRYQELDIHPSFMFRNHSKIPNIHARMDWDPDFESRRVILLLATKDLGPNQELLSSYNEIVL